MINPKKDTDQKQLDYIEFKKFAHDMGENESREQFENLWKKISPAMPAKH